MNSKPNYPTARAPHPDADTDDPLLPAIAFQHLQGLPKPWQGFLLKVGAFPQSLAEGAPVAMFLQNFLQQFRAAHPQLHHQVWLQFWKLSAQSGSDILAENVQEWTPEYGLGIWPGRQSPQAWNETLMMDAAAALFHGNEPELPAYRLLRLKASPDDLDDAVEEFRGLGVLLQAFSIQTPKVLDMTLKEMYLPQITEPSFRRADFFAPLLDCRVLASARSAQDIDRWMRGIDLYIRESGEDKGILVLSRIPLGSFSGQQGHI